MMNTCCYDGCNCNATEYDVDGDEACEFHSAKSETYVFVESDFDAEFHGRVEEALRAEGWDVTFRAPLQGEAVGTYRHDHGRGLKILGFSAPVPEYLRVAVDRAYNAAA